MEMGMGLCQQPPKLLLRSINRSVRKFLPSQVNKSNAKKHGGFPRRNSRFLNCGLPRLSTEQISPSMTALTFGRHRRLILPMQRMKRTDARCEIATEHGHA